MGEQNRESTTSESLDDLYDPMVAVDVDDDLLDELEAGNVGCDKARLAAKRRKAEQRLEAMRLREELGDYDFDFDDDF